MGSRYLLELGDVCAGTGLVVHLEPGWETRARSSGGYSSGLPSHVMTHHTASGASSDGQSDVNYCCYGSDNRPIANLYLSRAGEVWVMAAGATNTNGSGSDSWGGGVPDDSMNASAIGIEAANNGTGEVWPDVQQRAYGTLVGALCSAYGITSHCVRQHSEWAVGRKLTRPARRAGRRGRRPGMVTRFAPISLPAGRAAVCSPGRKKPWTISASTATRLNIRFSSAPAWPA